jgi:hypothetical protein
MDWIKLAQGRQVAAYFNHDNKSLSKFGNSE